MRMDFATQLIGLMVLISILVTINCYASNLGVMGETYPIAESDFLDFIQSRVEELQKNGQWQVLQNHVQQDASSYRDRPKSGVGIVRAGETKSWIFDPSIILDHDVITNEGKVIAFSGTRINPLHFIALSKTLIFYNSDDPKQVSWVVEQDKRKAGRDKLILVNGSVLNEEKRFKKVVYFDQGGRLSSHFGITHVPARVLQEGQVLRITEVGI